MKYTNVVLTIIALLLAAIALRLFEMRIALINQSQSDQQLMNSQQAVISSNQKLELSLNDLRKQIAEISNQLTRK